VHENLKAIEFLPKLTGEVLDEVNRITGKTEDEEN